MWRRMLNRAGRAILSVGAAAAAQYVTQSPYALAVAPILSVVGKWMRERGFTYVPF